MADSNYLDIYYPRSKLGNSQNVAMDIGGSLLKMAYVDQGKSGDGDTVAISFKNFNRTKVSEALDFIQSKNLVVKKDKAEEEVTIQTTGNGSYQYAVKIQDTLGTKMVSLPETKCFVDAFLYLLKNYPENQIIEAQRAEPLESVKKQMTTLLAAFQAFADQGVGSLPVGGFDLNSFFTAKELSSSPLSLPDDFFPCILVMCGSAIAPLKVHSDGHFDQMNLLTRGGSMLLGMGSLLTGAKTYDELLSLAVQGNHKALDICAADLKVAVESEDRENVYQAAMDNISEDMLVYNMGKAAGKSRDDFRPEDIAAAYVRMAVADIVNVVYADCKDSGTHNVFFSGSFVNHQFIKDTITEEWAKLNINGTLFKGKARPLSAHYMKHGSYLGALGALLQPSLK